MATIPVCSVPATGGLGLGATVPLVLSAGVLRVGQGEACQGIARVGGSCGKENIRLHPVCLLQWLR